MGLAGWLPLGVMEHLEHWGKSLEEQEWSSHKISFTDETGAKRFL